MVSARNANEAWAADDLCDVQSAVENAPPGSLLVADLGIPPFVVQRAAESAHARGMSVVLDPAPPEHMEERLYPLADILTPNALEAQRLSGRAVASAEDAGAAAAVLRERGTSAVVIKLQNGGCVVATAQGWRHFTAVPVPVVDTTGAGDAFAGALAVALLEGRTLDQAALMGTAAAAIAVGGYGAQPSYPDRSRLDGMFQLLQEANARSPG
jgi:ribokinase